MNFGVVLGGGPGGPLEKRRSNDAGSAARAYCILFRGIATLQGVIQGDSNAARRLSYILSSVGNGGMDPSSSP